jgi:predicted fused transcriptional regulator/phosphomethylpyrimidine kinase
MSYEADIRVCVCVSNYPIQLQFSKLYSFDIIFHKGHVGVPHCIKIITVNMVKAHKIYVAFTCCSI